MNDRELLELAAKAAGYTLKWGEVFIIGGDEVDCTDMSYVLSGQPDEADWHWSPLTDDGDALRLAVKMGFVVNCWLAAGKTWAGHSFVLSECDATEKHGTDPYAATRRAIVRAAAEIGKGMK